MLEIMYRPEECGTEVRNNRGKRVIIRKYHLTDDEKIRNRKRWEEDIIGVDQSIRDMAGDRFFNPYRRGIYYYQVQTLFLLGCNEWHSLAKVKIKLIDIMSSIKVNKNGIEMTAWEIFRNRRYRTNPTMNKDYLGAVVQKFPKGKEKYVIIDSYYQCEWMYKGYVLYNLDNNKILRRKEENIKYNWKILGSMEKDRVETLRLLYA